MPPDEDDDPPPAPPIPPIPDELLLLETVKSSPPIPLDVLLAELDDEEVDDVSVPFSSRAHATNHTPTNAGIIIEGRAFLSIV